MASFDWNPDEKQNYDLSFWDTHLTATGAHFSKKCEKDFTMNAPGCTLTLEVTDGSDIQWPQLESGDADKKLNMLFEGGNFNIQSNGDVYIGLNTKDRQEEENASITMVVSEGDVNIRSPKASIEPPRFFGRVLSPEAQAARSLFALEA
ncbi:hypothetical protein [Serratia marcescens]|uniref:hypothetical protein n=1 Tax=Serratia marcescens TaxID=615 RepID=UPI00178858D8|nr:hypothetical protein [Serratia marcescens]